MRFRTHALMSVTILSIICDGGELYRRSSHTSFRNSSSSYNPFDKGFLGETRKKHHDESTVSILMGALMVKAILFPLAVKAMAVMSSVAVLLSTMSLIVSSIVGYTKLAWSSTHPILKVVHVNDAVQAKEENHIDYAGGYGNYPDILDSPSGPSIPLPEHHVHFYQK